MRFDAKLRMGLALLAAVAGTPWVTEAAAQEDKWKFTAAAYGWLAGIDGTVATFGAPGADVSKSVSDVLNDLDGTLMGLGEARRGRWSVAGDLFWVRLKEDHAVPVAALANNVNLTTESSMVTAVGGYAVVQDAANTLDVVAGARYWSVENTLRFEGGALNGVSATDKADWVDPVVGIKGQTKLGSKFYFNGWALVGSHSMWDVMGAIGYSVSEKFSVAAGYRVLSIDYSKDSFKYDVQQSGPMLGAVLNF